MLLIHSQDLSIHYFLGQFFSRATAHAIYWQKIIGAEIVQKIVYSEFFQHFQHQLA